MEKQRLVRPLRKMVLTRFYDTGPADGIASAWHGYKYIDPSQSGAVIPVVHVNGFKISERTIYGCMDNKELACLFSGYGYQARFVEDLANIDRDLANSLKWACREIRHIQKAARSGTPIAKPRWPVLIMRTPKGWGAPKKVHGELVEGSFRSHQVPLPAAKTDSEELSLLQQWLRSYHPSEIFDLDGQVNAKIEESFPVSSKRLGQCQTSNPYRQTLDLQSWHKFSVPEGSQQSCLKVAGEFLAAAVHDNPHSLRIFSPDELVSNKLDAVFRHTGRNFQCDQYSRARGGQVVEILSEHTCQGNQVV
jgi:xylulose-5-phosphate/fructose-6-phosphate phosphoketolase